MNYTKIAHRIRIKIAQILGELSAGLDKTACRFVIEAVYGIISSKSVLLTEMGRSLETSVSLKKVEERFSRQLNKKGLWHKIVKNVLKKVNSKIGDNTLIIVDISDIQKKYARSMEYLTEVRDGSEKRIGKGYWVISGIATELNSDNLIPTYCSLYSQDSPHFKSENNEILRAVFMMREQFGSRGIYVIDRGGDRNALYRPFLEKGNRFIIRMTKNRDVIYGRKRINVFDLAQCCHCPYKDVIVKIDKGKEKVYEVEYGSIKVKLPISEKPLEMIVIKGIGADPIMLLTTEKTGRSRKKVEAIVLSYFKRWKIEETFRFIKQEYDLENIRLLRYRSLQNMMSLILLVFFVLSVGISGNDRLTVMTGMILKSAKSVFGVSKFIFYALGDGLSAIFKRNPGRIDIKKPKTLSLQIELKFQ